MPSASETKPVGTPDELMSAVREVCWKLDRLAGRLQYDDIYLSEVLEDLLDVERRLVALGTT